MLILHASDRMNRYLVLGNHRYLRWETQIAPFEAGAKCNSFVVVDLPYYAHAPETIGCHVSACAKSWQIDFLRAKQDLSMCFGCKTAFKTSNQENRNIILPLYANYHSLKYIITKWSGGKSLAWIPVSSRTDAHQRKIEKKIIFKIPW